MAEKNTEYSKKTQEIFRSLKLQTDMYHDARAEFNRLVGNPPDKENTTKDIAMWTGSYPWFIEWKMTQFLNEHGGKYTSFIISPVMYAKYRLYNYAVKKIRNSGPYYSACFRSPKVLVA